jgi:NADPH:quinone reductase-like Zn-dependent oxidoreductase
MSTMALESTTTMQAVVQDAYGPPHVLELRKVDLPVPGADEVRVRVRAAGVHWGDLVVLRGQPYVIRPVYGLRRPRNGIRGTDVSGTVEAVGANVTRFRPGDDVFGWCSGALAEYVCADAGNFVSKPDALSFEQAAAIPVSGCVALQALRDIAHVRPGQKVLVNGASGGIGTFAVQVAKAFGAEVTGVCSTANMDLVRSLGADHVIDYTREDFTTGGQHYDVILDMADKYSLSARRRVLTSEGTLIPNNGDGGKWFASTGRLIKARLLSLFVPQTLRPFVSLQKHDDLVALARLIESGDVTPVVGRTYPLHAAAEALAHVETGHVRGKTVIVI